jgi:hypothetical protein
LDLQRPLVVGDAVTATSYSVRGAY